MIKNAVTSLILILAHMLFSFSGAQAGSAETIHNWSGFTIGAKTGAVYSQFDLQTAIQSETLLNPDYANIVNNAGRLRLDRWGFISGIEGGYDWQINTILLGIKSDFQSLSTYGEIHSGALLSPNGINKAVITSYANNNWLFTARPRVGFIVDRWLLYATGGLALSLVQNDFVFSDYNFLSDSTQFSSRRSRHWKAGYVIGGGIETSLTNHISLIAEYLYEQFNQLKSYPMNNNLTAGQMYSEMVHLKSSIVTLGLIYHFSELPTQNPLLLGLFDLNQWENELGARLFFSSGLDGAPNPLLNQSTIGDNLASRLIFSHLSAVSQEIFGRFDHRTGLFLKGTVGAGSVKRGQLNDEDFPGGEVYSNTLSNVWGSLSYVTIDAGYSFIKSVFGNVDAFIGYNYFAQNLGAYGCRQLGGESICIPATELKNFLGISQSDHYQSMRIGILLLFHLTDKLSLISEAAYLPVVNLEGLDTHNARQLLGPESSHKGDGSMLEAILNYQLTNAWSAGLGGRYWMWNMRNGNAGFDEIGESEIAIEPARYNSKRYGVFLQIKYRNETPYILKDAPMKMDWRGIYIGGNLGGAWGKNTWSDPFGPTMSMLGPVNYAGFGNQIQSTGPLGGVGIGILGQLGQVVYGASGNFHVTNLRGENTLFSGIGGINGQTIIQSFGTIVGRIGTTFDRSLIYMNAGRAVIQSKYAINANTDALSLGSESQTMSNWGWTGGFGIEYAFNEHLTAGAEYNYIHIPRQVVSFPSVMMINAQRLTTKQVFNVCKLAMNYKFDILTRNQA